MEAQDLGAQLHAELLARGQMIASAESITGGGLGDLLTAAPGASETYLGGVVSYATAVKQQLLGVTDETVENEGVVSAACAREMAVGIRDLLKADFGVSTTGVAGPTEQEGKPVGLVYVGVAGPRGVRTVELELDGDRAEIRDQACIEAVRVVMESVVDPA